MGSFYSTCSLSDMTITDGDEMYIQFILPTWVKNPHSIDGEKIGCGEKGLRVSNEGSLGEFVPFGFPILGKYDDYGNIREVDQENPNVKMLEEFFNLTIYQLMDCATDDRWYKHSYKPEKDGEEEKYKGERKSWTIGGNKMANVKILKQLTVTYFNKENYDFLSSELMGDDNWWMDEVKSRFKHIKTSLSEIDEKRKQEEALPDVKERKVTDEEVQRYREIFKVADDVSDEDAKMDFLMILYSKGDWFTKYERDFYIPSISRVNMFSKLPIGSQFYDDIIKFYNFTINMSSMCKVLRPSYYGSQERNWGLNTRFHAFVAKNFGEKTIETDNEFIIDTVAYTVKSSLQKHHNKELVNEIVNEIIEELAEYGHTPKESENDESTNN